MEEIFLQVHILSAGGDALVRSVYFCALGTKFIWGDAFWQAQ